MVISTFWLKFLRHGDFNEDLIHHQSCLCAWRHELNVQTSQHRLLSTLLRDGGTISFPSEGEAYILNDVSLLCSVYVWNLLSKRTEIVPLSFNRVESRHNTWKPQHSLLWVAGGGAAKGVTEHSRVCSEPSACFCEDAGRLHAKRGPCVWTIH